MEDILLHKYYCKQRRYTNGEVISMKETYTKTRLTQGKDIHSKRTNI